MRPSTPSRPLLVAMCAALVAAQCGCSNGTKSTAPVADATMKQGELVLDMSDLANAQPADSRKAITEAAAMYKRLPPEVEAQIVEQTEYRLVVEMDWVRFGAAIGGGNPSGAPKVPVRQVWDFTPRGDQTKMKCLLYYIGDDPKMAQQLRDGYKGSPLEKNTPKD